MKLSQMKARENGIILSVNCTGELRRRLLDIGLIKGARVTLIRIAPLGDPIDIFLNGYHISLRKEEAEHIEMENLGEHPSYCLRRRRRFHWRAAHFRGWRKRLFRKL